MKNNLLISLRMPLLLLTMLAVLLQSCNNEPPTDLTKEVLIPKPVSVTATGKSFKLTNETVIYAESGNDQLNNVANMLSTELNGATGFVNKVENISGSVPEKGIFLTLTGADAQVGSEGYELVIEKDLITLKAAQPAGLFYGIQTLLQLVPLKAEGAAEPKEVRISTGTIRDYPTYAWRGSMLDVARHFFSVDDVKRYIDMIAAYKMNILHLHLTDDQGWRIEMHSYPKLNSIGSWRDSTLIGHFKDTPAKYERVRYGSYYTKKEIKEVIAYANVRGINIIPEIDIPGHSRATITAYPEFSTDPNNKWGVAATWGMYNRQNNVLSPNPKTFAFLRAVFHELADMFPSPYIHVGGDECSKLWWKQSPEAQAFIKANNLKDEFGLQTYFIKQVSQYLAEKGKKVIGWHEIMEGKLDTSTIVMNWGNDAKAVEAAEKGYPIIMTPGKPYYFDHYQSKDPKDSLAIHGYNPLEAVYVYEPVPASVNKKGLSDKIMGGQANVWTEYMGYPTKVDYMIFPRMTAVSETLWSQKSQKNYNDFLNRLKTNIIPRYQFWNSSWFPDFEKWRKE